MYSITPVLHNYANKKELHKILIQVIYKRMKIYVPTGYRVLASQWQQGQVTGLKHKNTINANIREKISALDERMLDIKGQLTKEQLVALLTREDADHTFQSFWPVLQSKYAGKLGKRRMDFYEVLFGKLERFNPSLMFSDISVSFLLSFEAWVRPTVAPNTVAANMSGIKAILSKAEVEGLVRIDQYKKYKIPKYEQKIPNYLTEAEVDRFFDMVRVSSGAHQRAGYYFLLSCYTGYRISDARAFNYAEAVKGETITLRAKKNGEIVSIPIHTKLKEVLAFVKDNPLTLSEQKTREYVKDIAKLSGLNRKIKFHASRHSWGMLLTSKGFSIEEVAETLGDTPDVARLYARITNEHLSKKILEKLK